MWYFYDLYKTCHIDNLFCNCTIYFYIFIVNFAPHFKYLLCLYGIWKFNKIYSFVLATMSTLSKFKIVYSFILSSNNIRKESNNNNIKQQKYQILNISHKITYSLSISDWEMTIRKFETMPNWTVLTLTRSPLQIFKCGLILNSEVNCEDTIYREDVGNIEKSLIKTCNCPLMMFYASSLSH